MVQMNDLAKLKQEHEATLLVKFQALLNNKKQHIRDLIQLLEKGREGTLNQLGVIKDVVIYGVLSSISI